MTGSLSYCSNIEQPEITLSISNLLFFGAINNSEMLLSIIDTSTFIAPGK